MASENIFLLYAALMGFFISFIYDWLRILRRLIPHNIFWVSVEDIIFWLFCAIEVFLLMNNESNGTLRWFAVLGALVGMIAYKKIISAFLVKYVTLVLTTIFRFLWKPFSIVGNFLKRGSQKLSKRIVHRKNRIGLFLRNKLTLFLKLLKIVLWKQ